MAKIQAEHDETNEINALIDSKLKLSSEISDINFWFVSGGRFRIMPAYTEAFLNTHVEHIHYVDIYPNTIRVTKATWNSSTQTWDFTNKDYT